MSKPDSASISGDPVAPDCVREGDRHHQPETKQQRGADRRPWAGRQDQVQHRHDDDGEHAAGELADQDRQRRAFRGGDVQPRRRPATNRRGRAGRRTAAPGRPETAAETPPPAASWRKPASSDRDRARRGSARPRPPGRPCTRRSATARGHGSRDGATEHLHEMKHRDATTVAESARASVKGRVNCACSPRIQTGSQARYGAMPVKASRKNRRTRRSRRGVHERKDGDADVDDGGHGRGDRFE